MNYKPKNSTVGVPGKGFIKAEDFTAQDLQSLIDRAKNRNLDVNTFLIGAGLVPITDQMPIFVEANEAPVEEKPKRTRKAKEVETETTTE